MGAPTLYTQVLSAHQCESALPVHISADQSGPGGASHTYLLQVHDAEDTVLRFQLGVPGAEGSIPGISNEALIAIVADRLHGFQEGSFSCSENGKALVCLDRALEFLQERTARILEESGGSGAICPSCGSPEIAAMTPRTVYSCGSSDYDGRPGTHESVCAGGG